MCVMDNKGFGQEVVKYLIEHYKIPVTIMVLCVLVASLFAVSRPVVYQSELIFSVGFNAAYNEVFDNKRVTALSRIITTDGVLQAVTDGSPEDAEQSLNKELLSTDYRGKVIRAQNQMTDGMIKIYAHGQTPEEAQNICNGAYEHFKAYSLRLKHDDWETKYVMKELEKKYNSAKQAYDNYCKLNADKIVPDDNNEYYQKKIDLYNNVIKWETTYQDFLRDNLRQKNKKGYQLNLISEATLPTSPIPSRTGFIVGIGFLAGLIICLVYGMLTVKINFK